MGHYRSVDIIRGLAVSAIAATLVVATACDGGSNATATSTPAARDHCTELEFVDGEQRDEAGLLVAECRSGPTPNGGVYSISRYSGSEVEITEYDEDGNVVQRTHGTR